jgi:hypothetical protein
MAHFAQILNGVVARVIVVNNNELLVDGVENGLKGVEFCQDLFGGEWVQTSYNNNIRKQYAGVGYRYDAVADVFITPQPFPSWSLDENYDWQAPIDYPADGKNYSWDEANQVWVESPAI